MKHLLNKLKPYLLSLLVITSLAVIFIGVSRAADKTVACDGSGCNSGSDALFEETNIAPGDSVTQSIEVDNSDNPDDCGLTLQTKNDIEGEEPGDFATKLFTVIKDGGVDVFGVRDGNDKATDDKSLADVFAAGPVSLGTIAAGATNTFDWTVTFGLDAGNTYQSAETEFDFDLVFECGEPEVLGLGGVGGPVGAPVCTDAKPGLPTDFAASAGPGTGVVNLSWTPPTAPYTYFLIAYSDSSDWPPKWGNPDVGNVTSYTASGLGSGVYWFWLRAGNGCMPGDFVGPISPGAIAGVPGAGPVAPGFLPGVLGVEEEKEVKGVGEEVLGEEACTDEYHRWWLPLVIQAILTFGYLWFIRKREEKAKRWWLIPIVLAILSQIVHGILDCNCATGEWCPRYWLLNLIVLTVLLFAYYFFRKRKSKFDIS